jgi:hypothetical protein
MERVISRKGYLEVEIVRVIDLMVEILGSADERKMGVPFVINVTPRAI